MVPRFSLTSSRLLRRRASGNIPKLTFTWNVTLNLKKTEILPFLVYLHRRFISVDSLSGAV